MKYLDLFNEIQLSRDYSHDKKTGVDWRYRIDKKEQRVFVEMQETKTGWDWVFNFLAIPKTVKNGKLKITVPLGFYLQAKAAFEQVYEDWLNGKFPAGYQWFFTGWSQGGASAAVLGFLMHGIVYGNLIMYGTPAFLANQKSLETLCGCFDTVDNFVYENDWILPLVPLYKRPPSVNVQPKDPDNPETLDQRHRVYGHCLYPYPEF